MKILDRYIVKRFLKTTFLGLIAFAGILAITDSMELIGALIAKDSSIPILLLIKYILYKVPITLTLVLPVAVLLSTLLTIGGLIREGELTAMRAAGISEHRIVAPIILSSILLSILSFIWGELVVPHANSSARSIKEGLISKVEKERDVSFYGGGRFFNIKEIDLKKKLLYGIQILECYKDGAPKRRVDAEWGKWKGEDWYLFNVVERRFSREGELLGSAKFAEKEIEIGKFEKLRDIIRMRRNSYEMSFVELARYIKLLKRMGRKAKGAIVDLHLKISFPFTSVVMALLGVPLSLQNPFGGKLPGFGLSILISFLYWGAIALGRSLGQSGILPPPLSAWFGNIVFLLVGLYMIRVKKLKDTSKKLFFLPQFLNIL